MKPRDSALAQPLVRVTHVLEWAYPLNSRQWRGKQLHHGGDVYVLCLASKKPSEREFFVPAGTDLAVKLLTILAKKKIAPNAIFRVVLCFCLLCDLTCLILISLKNSTHSRSYEA